MLFCVWVCCISTGVPPELPDLQAAGTSEVNDELNESTDILKDITNDNEQGLQTFFIIY